eukprot:CAMPEP_0117677556 /NCGR_PEP_ID=MMETSP0804-20121206/16808_1 /TAXON_ID=1074897 /ORGANISM="Tetraselmis astigmatica, Strain CCMP880" /LENGTH=318 /DNA_ID=CAMNT_0005486847 /DNA_START=369 /DNA_END=1329 /DNA_ORIENTATION=-
MKGGSDLQAGHHTSMPAVSGWTRVSMAVGVIQLLVTINLLSMYGVLGTVGPEYLQHRQTPLTPQSWAFSLWILILFLQGMAVVDQALPTGYGEAWKSYIVATLGVAWQIGWACEITNQLALYSQTLLGLWVGLTSLLAATSAFAWTLVRLYNLRRKFSLGPPTAKAYCLYFASTSINTAWLSFCLADGVLVVAQAHGAPLLAVDILAVVLIMVVWAAALWVVTKKKASYYGLTIVWVLVAVYGRQTAQPMPAICLLLLLGLGLATIFSVIRRRNVCGAREKLEPANRVDEEMPLTAAAETMLVGPQAVTAHPLRLAVA